ncbi:folylpolyglutamate synthase-like [Dorcoceras hygrometricum]|uniref:Folylpolyglutamate synthase-like n=1 Tax=Dorcoceras hygrometricum TaxID=472368 RepID=A0A2Z7DDU5_9LAMI|nr:folylpolyglutamate synthase-like [Dorcoceras hygrometricum]
MRAVKESVNLGQRVSWQIKGDPLYHAQPISRGNHRSVIFRAGHSNTHQSSVVFRHHQSVGHHSNDSVGPFRHDTSVRRLQRGSFSGSQSIIRLNMYACMPGSWQSQRRSSIPRTANQPGKSSVRELSGLATQIPIRARWYSDTTNQSVTTQMIALDLSGTTHLFADYNVALSRVLNQSSGSIYCGSLRQSGPRPDPRLLRQAALEALTRSARTDSPRRTGRKQFSGDDRRRRGRRTTGGGGGAWGGGEGQLCARFRVNEVL